jgi:predicted methyltransferase
MRAIGVSFVAVAMLTTAYARDTEAIPGYVAAAVGHPGRPDMDRQLDEDRKPAQVITFAGLKAGDKVADFLPATGYFSRLFCRVVGESGHVYAIAVPPDRPGAAAVSTTSVRSAAESSSGQGCTNVTAYSLHATNHPAPELHSDSDDPGWVYEYWSTTAPAESFTAPEPLDVIWIADNYHTLHSMESGALNLLLVNRAMLAALRTGGILVVEDRPARAGSGARDSDTAQWIDPVQVKKELTAAGFEYLGESDVLRHVPGDSADRFLLKFRRP